jgi:hypothetical protein
MAESSHVALVTGAGNPFPPPELSDTIRPELPLRSCSRAANSANRSVVSDAARRVTGTVIRKA